MNSNRLVSIVLGMLTVGVLALGWVLGVSPKLAEVSTADSERALVDAQNLGYQTQLVQLAADFERLPELQAAFDPLEKAIPAGAEIEDFLDGLAAAASATGVTITSVTPGEAAPQVAADGTVSSEGPLVIPIEISVSGSMGSTVAFIDAVQNSPRLTVVSLLRVVAGESSSGTLTGALYVIPTEPLTQATAGTQPQG